MFWCDQSVVIVTNGVTITESCFTFAPAELQLKPRHQPYKLCRQWQDLLYRFTEASEDDISQGESLVCLSLYEEFDPFVFL